MPKILVFVVRHGEREDEAVMSRNDSCSQTAHGKMTKQDRLDPKLTPEGHHQAFRAFENLLSALEFADVNKVAVFSSPLRRAIGTAMMLSTAMSTFRLNGKGDTKRHSVIQFVLPSTACNETREQSYYDPPKCIPIPIVVENGLCNCTALVTRIGGNRSLVRGGLLSCAAMPQNSVDHPRNHLLRETLIDIKATAMKSDTIQEAVKEGQPQPSVQFWRSEEGLEISSSKFVPMAPPISFDTNILENDDDANCSCPYDTSIPASFFTEGQKSIDQVVGLSLVSGCDACIVSSHREEIKELYRYRCGYEHSKKDIPYCGIGVFEVYREDDRKSGDGSFHQPISPLQWIFHDVVAPEDLPVSLIHDILSQTQRRSEDLSIPITYPVIERTTLFLCEAYFLVDNSAFQHSITGVKSLCVTGVSTSPDLDGNKPPGPHHIDLHFQIVKGHHSWLKFLKRLREDAAIGDIEYEAEGTLKKGKVLIRPYRQEPLPCPPKAITIEVFPLSSVARREVEP
jgi:hypothetical protein